MRSVRNPICRGIISILLDSMELCTSVGFLFAVAAAVLRVSSSIVELSRSSVWGGAAVLAHRQGPRVSDYRRHPVDYGRARGPGRGGWLRSSAPLREPTVSRALVTAFCNLLSDALLRSPARVWSYAALDGLYTQHLHEPAEGRSDHLVVINVNIIEYE